MAFTLCQDPFELSMMSAVVLLISTTNDDDWERELFIESSSFGLGAIAGSAVTYGGGALLTFLVVATPIGWVGLIVTGVAIAGTAATASVVTNNLVKEDAGGAYDWIMNWVDSW